jgi:hypothetical protein
VPLDLQSQTWPSNRAVLLVHGIGNAKPGDYTLLRQKVEAALGPAAADTAIYQLFYDQVNDWFAAKTQLGDLLQKAIGALADRIDDATLGQTIAEVCGDVLWPVLIADARAAVREVYLRQLKQMVQDGMAAGHVESDQKLSIICHSLGCFHTYEVLHHAARTATHGLRPASDGVRFENVVFMASPVQLIRSVANAPVMDKLIPNRRWLYAVQGDALSIPFEESELGNVSSVKRWVSITGNLDPVGGHFFRERAPWASMEVPGQETFIDKQDALNIGSKQELVQRLASSLRAQEPPDIKPNNPHSWENYVDNHAAQLRTWLT